jgi:hypothetical protein
VRVDLGVIPDNSLDCCGGTSDIRRGVISDGVRLHSFIGQWSPSSISARRPAPQRGSEWASNNPSFAVGDVVSGLTGWQDYVVMNAKGQFSKLFVSFIFRGFGTFLYRVSAVAIYLCT